MSKKQKEKPRYSKFIVALVIILNVLFTTAVLYIYKTTMSEPTTLIISFFGFTTTELLALAMLKRNEDKNKSDCVSETVSDSDESSG